MNHSAAAAVLLLLLLAACTEAAPPATAESGVEAGKRIYRDGLLASGDTLRATVQRDVPVDAAQLSCAYCHRRSGLGTSEGGRVAPALTTASLFMERQAVLRKAYRSKAGSGLARPAYTDETLALAIRSGVDPAGRVLGDMMPRYELDDAEMASLISYMRTLGGHDAPGVTESTLHVATIVSEGVSVERRRAMLDVFETYVRDKNVETRNEVRNAEHAPFYREFPHRAYRKWELHVWELDGPSDTWRAQLDEHYRALPVFAVVGGLASGPWRPIHEFCESTEVPCLFPHTDLPVVEREDFYSLYLSRGLALEARALARFLLTDLPADVPIVQVWAPGTDGAVAAGALRRALARSDRAAPRDGELLSGGSADAAFWASLLDGDRPAVLILWLRDPDLSALAGAAGPVPARVFLSSSLAGSDPRVPEGIRDRVRLVHPFDVPAHAPRKLARLNNWLDAKGLDRRDPRIQADTYFAVTFFSRGMAHIKQNFSREYLIEVLEHALDNATFSSLYPYVSLGPGQRFASRGSYVLGPAEAPETAWVPVSDWIIP